MDLSHKNWVAFKSCSSLSEYCISNFTWDPFGTFKNTMALVSAIGVDLYVLLERFY